MNWYHIALVLTGCELVPLFVVGQYEPREPFIRWWSDLQIHALHRLGLYQDAERLAVEVLVRIQGEFRESGKELNLVRGASGRGQQQGAGEARS